MHSCSIHLILLFCVSLLCFHLAEIARLCHMFLIEHQNINDKSNPRQAHALGEDIVSQSHALRRWEQMTRRCHVNADRNQSKETQEVFFFRPKYSASSSSHIVCGVVRFYWNHTWSVCPWAHAQREAPQCSSHIVWNAWSMKMRQGTRITYRTWDGERERERER